MLTHKIEFDTVALTDAVRQLPNGWACSVSDKYDIIKTAYITSIITCCDIAGVNNQWEITTHLHNASSQDKQHCGFCLVKNKSSEGNC